MKRKLQQTVSAPFINRIILKEEICYYFYRFIRNNDIKFQYYLLLKSFLEKFLNITVSSYSIYDKINMNKKIIKKFNINNFNLIKNNYGNNILTKNLYEDISNSIELGVHNIVKNDIDCITLKIELIKKKLYYSIAYLPENIITQINNCFDNNEKLNIINNNILLFTISAKCSLGTLYINTNKYDILPFKDTYPLFDPIKHISYYMKPISEQNNNSLKKTKSITNLETLC